MIPAIALAAAALAGPGEHPSFELCAGLDAAGPLVFRDLPDQTLAPPTVLAWGGHVGFGLGAPGREAYRFGASFGWRTVARTTSGQLVAVDPLATVAAGGPIELKLGVGARLVTDDGGLRDAEGRVPFAGPMASLELRHAFVDEDGRFPVGFALGAVVEGVLGTPAGWSSAFAGGRLDLVVRNDGTRGGTR